MKLVMKILACIGGVILLAKLAQVLIDVLYESFGKRYISSEQTDN